MRHCAEIFQDINVNDAKLTIENLEQGVKYVQSSQ